MSLKASSLLPSDPDRLAALRRFGVLKNESQASYARAASLAARAINAPVALVLLVAETSLRVAAAHGLNLANTTRKLPFKLEGLLHDRFIQSSDPSRVQILNDLIDPQNPPQFAFHAAVPIQTSDGRVLGSLCVLDEHARTLGPNQALLLEGISDHLMNELNLRLELWQASQAAPPPAESHQPLLERVLEGTNLAVFATTPEGLITSWNPACERTFGHSAREVLGRNVAFFMPEDTSNERLVFERIAGGDRFEASEVTRLHKDGRPLRVRLHLSSITGPGGRVMGLAHICEDISAEHANQQRASTIRDHLEKLHQQLPSLRFAVDLDGVITLVEGKALELIGQPRALIGQRVFDLYARYPQLCAAVRQALHGQNFEGLIETSNRRFQVVIQALEHNHDPQKTVIGATGLALLLPDPPAQTKATAFSLEQVLEALPDAVLISGLPTTTHGQTKLDVIYANQAFETQSGLAIDILTMPGTNLPTNPLIDPSVFENALETLKNENQYSEEIVSYGNDGSSITIEWRVVALKDQNSNISHLLSLQRDISQQTQVAELMLARSNQPSNTQATKPSIGPKDTHPKDSVEDLSTYLEHLSAAFDLEPNSSAIMPAALMMAEEQATSNPANPKPTSNHEEPLKVGLQGQLEEVGGAATLLQMISMIVQSGVLHLKSPQNQQIKLFLQAGRLVHIEHPSLHGIEAVLHTLGSEQGHFHFIAGQSAAQNTLALDPVTLALEVAKRRDETKSSPEPELPDSNGLVVLPNVRVALDFVSGIGGLEHFCAQLESDARWGQERVVLRGRGVRVVVLNGALSDLPSTVNQILQPAR